MSTKEEVRREYYDDISREEALSYRLKIYPRVDYYHSTSSVYAERIMKEGLCKRSVTSVATVYLGEFAPELAEKGVEDAIFVTARPVKSWASLVCKKVGGKPIYFIVPGINIIRSKCNAYPDFNCLQPLDKYGGLLARYVNEIMLLDCDCIKVGNVVYFEV